MFGQQLQYASVELKGSTHGHTTELREVIVACEKG